MKLTSLENARSEVWDVVIVGTSFAACFFAYSLKNRGLSVLFIERGPFVEHFDQIENQFTYVPPQVRQNNTSGQRKDWVVRHQFGGCSNCWWGNTPRLHPSDFELKSRYGVGQDWPVSYAELEPFLVQAEYLMDTTGPENTKFAPRSAVYPFPAHAPTQAESRLFEEGSFWEPMPSARSNGGRRANCCATGSCSLCPIDAKFTILNSIELFEDEKFFYVTDTECRSIETTAGTATSVIVQSSAGESHSISGNFIALAANPISNSAILLRSGLGNDLVGRGFHEQLGQFIWLDIPFDNYYGGSSITGLGLDLYDGDFRSKAASVLIESWNSPPSLRLENGKWLQRLKLKFVAEDLPLPQNRVTLEDDEAIINWTGHSDYAFAGLERARERLPSLIPFEYEKMSFGGFEPTEAHIIGGTPMATDPTQGVVDSNCRLFDKSNVACLGSSNFPTGGAANPTLTLSALSLYAGEQL